MTKEVEQRLDFSDYPASEQFKDEQRLYKDAVFIVALADTWGWFHSDNNGGSFGFSEPGEKLIDFYPRLRKLYPDAHHIHFTLNKGLEEWLADRLLEIRESQTKGTTIHKLSTVTTLAQRGIMDNKRGGR